MAGALRSWAGLCLLLGAIACGRAQTSDDIPKVATPDRLLHILQQAKGGETLALQPGYYPELTLRKQQYNAPVILDGKGLVIFKKIALEQINNVTFRNVLVEAGTVELQDRDYAVNIHNSRNIIVENSRIGWSADSNWMNDGMGMTVRLSENVRIGDTIFHDSFIGLVIRDSDNITVERNIFRDLRRDGINVSGSVDITLNENTCTDFHSIRPVDHPDCIQFWNDTAVRSNENIQITGNNVLRGKGSVSQGIFLSGQKPGLPHRNVLIEDNIVHQGMGQGIFVHKAEDVVIRNNKTLPAYPVEFLPGLTIRPPVTRVVAEGNVVSRLEITPELISSGMVTEHNNIVRTNTN